MVFPDENRKEIIKAHPFFTKEGAEAAMIIVNDGEGIPASENAITTTYTTPFEHDGMWYIKSDAITDKYFNSPVDIEVTV